MPSDNPADAASAATAVAQAPAEPVSVPAAPALGGAPAEPMVDVDAAAAPGAETPVESKAEADSAAETPAGPVAEAGLLSASEPEAAAGKPAEPEVAKPATAEVKQPDGEPRGEAFSYAEHPLTLPEGVEFDEARLGEYDAVLAEHRLAPEARQRLADLYIADRQAFAEQTAKDQWETWAISRAAWREACAADPQFGGSAFETHKAAAIRMIEFAVPPAERAEFNLFLRTTGAADHPQFFRMLNRFAQHFAQPAGSPPGLRPAPPQNRDVPRSLRGVYAARRNRE